MQWSLYQFQCQLHYYRYTQAAGAYACQQQPENIVKQSLKLYECFTQSDQTHVTESEIKQTQITKSISDYMMTNFR